MGWLIPSFKTKAEPNSEGLSLRKFNSQASDRSIQIKFRARYQNRDMQKILDGVLSGLPDPDAFHACISNISSDSKNTITVSLHAKNPQDVSKEIFQTLSLMLIKHIKTDLTGESPKTGHSQPVPTPH
jgi:hypothetical protein